METVIFNEDPIRVTPLKSGGVLDIQVGPEGTDVELSVLIGNDKAQELANKLLAAIRDQQSPSWDDYFDPKDHDELLGEPPF